jgi:hypothetical protein
MPQGNPNIIATTAIVATAIVATAVFVVRKF